MLAKIDMLMYGLCIVQTIGDGYMIAAGGLSFATA